MNSDEVKIGKKIIETLKERGEVIDSSKEEVTHVKGGGGGGSGGNVAPVHISSYTTTKHEFWIKGEDGIEQSYNLQDSNLPLRTGHIISIFLIRLKGSEARYPVFVVNHTTGTWNFICTDGNLEYILGKKYIGWLGIFLPVFIALVAQPFTDSEGFGLFIAGLSILWIPIPIFYNIIVYYRYRYLLNKLSDYLNDMGQTILRDG